MKSLKVLAASTLALAVAGSALADTSLKVTGSSAYRKALYAAIVDQLGSETGATVNAAYYASAAGIAGANQAVFVAGTTPSKITIQCCIAGSVGGVHWVAGQVNVATDKDDLNTGTAWISASNTMSSVTISGGQATGGTQYSSSSVPVWDAAAPAQITMSDSYQDSTQFNSTNYPPLTEQSPMVGVVQFAFSKGKLYDNVSSTNAAGYLRFTNMTTLGFQALAASGCVPLSSFTGVQADDNIDVVLVGRDSDSGTRLGTFYETAFGSDQTPATQYLALNASSQDVGTTGTGPIASLSQALNAGDLVGNPNFAGYSSGGNVKNVIGAAGTASTGVVSPNSHPAILVGYLGVTDLPVTKPALSTDTTTSYGQVLTYNGYALYDTTGTQQPQNTENGQYTFWTNEHMYWKGLQGSVSTAGTQKYIAKGIADKIRATYATSAGGLFNSVMNCSRASEGAPVITTLP